MTFLCKSINAFVHSIRELADRNTPVVVLLPKEEDSSLLKKIQATKILLGQTGCSDLHREINKIFMQQGYPRTLIRDDIKQVKRISIRKLSETLANIDQLTKEKITGILKRELSHLKKFHQQISGW